MGGHNSAPATVSTLAAARNYLRHWWAVGCPDEIHRLVEAHAPLERFEETLSRLVSEHRWACARYAAASSCSRQRFRRGWDAHAPRSWREPISTFAEFERDCVRERVLAGMRNARARGKAHR